MKTILMGSIRVALVAALMCLTTHANADVVGVNSTITVLADGSVVPIVGGNLDSSGFTAPAGLLGPTSGGTYQYAVRERFAAQQGQTDRAGYSFFDFDVSNLTTDPTDPTFSAIFTIDYVGHLNDANAWSVDLGQVTSAWDTTGNDPTRALAQGSTSVGLLLAGVQGQPTAITGLSVDITALVQGWADGSIANNGLTFTGTGGALSSQAAYFNNAVITTSVTAVPEPASAIVGVLGLGLCFLRRRR